MKLDLRKDFKEIYAHVVDRVNNFGKVKNKGPGKPDAPVAAIELGFTADQDGWIALVFDTRPDAQPDGEWNNYIEKNLFKRAHWLEATEAVQSGPLELILPDGKKKKVSEDTDEEEYIAIYGELLKAVLLKARADGVFKSLRTATACHLGVEEMDGRYGWPPYEERGKDDLV